MRPLLAPSSVPHRCGGEGGIRTRGAFDSTLLFESSTLNHSDTSPREIVPVSMSRCQGWTPMASSIRTSDRSPSMVICTPSGMANISEV